MRKTSNICKYIGSVIRRICILIVSVFLLEVHAQWSYNASENFDGNIPKDHLQLQSVIFNTNNNCWQIGQPIKNKFTAAPSAPNAILTDSWDSYPVNSHSEFILQISDTSTRTLNSHLLWAYRWTHFLDMEYKKDFGLVHFSIDSGQTWENVFTSPKIYNIFGFQNQNVDTLPNGERGFTGIDTVGSSIWVCFRHHYALQDSINYLKLRFTFISDSMDTGQDGWMIDNFELSPTVVHTLQKFEGQGLAMHISPVPADDALYIKAPTIPESRDIDLLIIRNAEGKEMFRGEHLAPYYRIITRDYPDGVYTVSMHSGPYQETKAITIQHQR